MVISLDSEGSQRPETFWFAIRALLQSSRGWIEKSGELAGWKSCPKWIQDLVDVFWLSAPAVVIDVVDLDLVVKNTAAHAQ